MGQKFQDEEDEPIMNIDELLVNIEKGNIPIRYLLSGLLDLLIKLDEKERKLEQHLSQLSGLSDLNRKVSEIHTLHFPSKELKKKTRRDRLLAQILMSPARPM